MEWWARVVGAVRGDGERLLFESVMSFSRLGILRWSESCVNAVSSSHLDVALVRLVCQAFTRKPPSPRSTKLNRPRGSHCTVLERLLRRCRDFERVMFDAQVATTWGV